MSKILTTVFASGFMLLCQVSMSHADDVFMWSAIFPAGLSTEKVHKDWHDVQTVAWGHEFPPGSRMTPGLVNITKVGDSSSAAFAAMSAAGQVISEIRFEITRPTGNVAPMLTSRLKLTNARITSFAATVQRGGLPNEAISFSFDSITWVNYKIDPIGKLVVGTQGCWDILKNMNCTIVVW